MANTFLVVGNKITMWLLRSPLHPLLSGRMLIVEVTGRKSGRHYQTPVEYARTGDDLYILSHETRTWWRNVRPTGPVQVRLKGTEMIGSASVSTDLEQIRNTIRLLFPKMSAEKQNQLAVGKVTIRIADLHAA